VRPGSPAAGSGIRAGELVLRVNGRAPRDYIDYRYQAAEARVRMLVQDRSGKGRRVTVTKTVDEGLGIRFTEDVFDGVRTCRNRCPFCFVDQLPRGLRPALYVRDDDYRLSFLHGNFITLTNLSPADRARIVQLHLSPLYVSVHATEPAVRTQIFGRPGADIVAEMRDLVDGGIELQAQVVVCPGVNDGAHLEMTVRGLAALHPGVRSIGVVPVGLTRHRRGLPRVRPVGRAVARRVIGQIHRWQREFLDALGSRLVFAADEMYLSLGLPLPGRAQYEGFPQLSNGIGGARLLVERVRRMRPPRLRRALSVTLVTGEMAAGLVNEMAVRLEADGGVRARVCAVQNRLLGRSVTTAGLLAGRDIVRAVRGGRKDDLVIVPGAAIREGDGFLDGMSVEEVSRRLAVPVVGATWPREVGAALRRFDRERGGR